MGLLDYKDKAGWLEDKMWSNNKYEWNLTKVINIYQYNISFASTTSW